MPNSLIFEGGCLRIKEYSPGDYSVGPENVHFPDFSKVTTNPSGISPGKGSVVDVGGFVGGMDMCVAAGGRGVEVGAGVSVNVLGAAAAVKASDVASF